MQKTLKKIKEVKRQIDDTRPLSQTELRELQKWYKVTYTYNSNAIEGNTLTLAETKIVVEDGLTVAGHSVKEILEAVNHTEIIDDLINIVKQKKRLTENLLLKMHKTLIRGIDDENAGKYRKVKVFISGSLEELPLPKDVPNLMKKFFNWHEKNKKIEPVILAADAHYRFVKIHPFIDGNGRMARLLSNFILMQHGYPMIIIPIIKRLEYISYLSQNSTKEKFIKFFAETALANMQDHLRMISND
jgi:Fic family protein